MNRSVIVLVCSIICLSAHAAPPVRTVNPEADSVVCARMRARMDSIRKQRPTVALVLSGGGAKGAAHIGVLRRMNEVGIPVDVVLGTSMGGLIGGLYAVGNPVDSLEAIISSLDWDLLLKDKLPPERVPYQEKLYKSKFLVAIPFLYSKKSLSGFVEGQSYASELASKPFKQNFLGSLPAGYSQGQFVSGEFSNLTLGYHGDIDFMDLPVPFFCISSELVSGKAYLWHKGSLAAALRSTMSIPGLYAPVRVDGMIMVDGGMRNNFPADLARQMGADIIIGVELSDAAMEYSDINNLADMVMRMTDIMGEESFEANVNIPDIKIKPDMSGYNMLSFSKENILDIIQRGYDAAVAKDSLWYAVKARLGGVSIDIDSRLIDFSNHPVLVSDVVFDGLTSKEARFLLDKSGLHPGMSIDKKGMDAAIERIYATASFKLVTYELLGDTQPFTLRIKCEKGQAHQFGFGVRVDSETLLSALVNLGFNTHMVQGSSLNVTSRLSQSPYLKLNYQAKIPKFPVFNFDSHIGFTQGTLSRSLILPRIDASFFSVKEEMYLSDILEQLNLFKAGAGFEYFKTRRLSVFGGIDDIPSSYDSDNFTYNYFSSFIEVGNNSLDDLYFPTRGWEWLVGYKWNILSRTADFKPFGIAQFRIVKPISLGPRFVLTPSAYGRFLPLDAETFFLSNLVGGSMSGRYLDQQIPFVGINNVRKVDNMMWLASIDFRCNVYGKHYVSLKADALNDSYQFDRDLLDLEDICYGFGLEYAWNLPTGPLKALVQWSNFTDKASAYVSIGFDF